jgi:hypothetical protein
MVYGPDIVKQGEQYAYLQMTQKQMAALWGVTEQTIVDWKARHPEFTQALERGAARPIADAAQTLIAAAGKDWKAAVEVLQRRARPVWGDVKQTEIGGTNGTAIEFVTLTDDERKSRLAAAIADAQAGGDLPTDAPADDAGVGGAS